MEFEEAYSFPFQCMELEAERVLVVGPHPDDETYGCGGTLCRLKDLGSEIRIVVLTDGVRGDGRHRYDPSEYVRLREEEVRRAASRLGMDPPEFWGLPDRELHRLADLKKRLSQLIWSFQPTLVFTSSPLDVHPDHRYTAQLLYNILREEDIPPGIRLAFCEVVVPFRPTHLVDVTSVYPRKRAAMECFATQQEEVDYLSKVSASNRYRSFTLPAEVEYAEAFWILQPAEAGPLSFEYLRHTDYFELDFLEEAPLVTVIVRTRNRHEWLRQALASVQAQTYANLEIVVVNDGGEPLEEVLAPFRRAFPVEEVAHERTRGRPAAANSGLARARGAYVNFLDDDDLLYPSHVESLVRFARKSSARAVYSDCDVVRYQWKNKEWIPEERRPFRRTGPVVPASLFFENQLPNMTVLFERELAEEIGPFDEALDIYEDWDPWLRLAGRTEMQYLPQVTAEYRQIGAQGIGVGGREYDFWEWSVKIWKKHWPELTPRHVRLYQEKILGQRTLEREKEFQEKMSALHRELYEARLSREQLQQQRDHLGEEHRKLAEAYRHMQAEHESLAEEYRKAIEAHGQLSEEYEKAAAASRQAFEDYQQLAEEHNLLAEAHNRLAGDYNRSIQENLSLGLERDHFRAKAQALDAQLESVYASKSWRITGPYRRMGEWVRRS